MELSDIQTTARQFSMSKELSSLEIYFNESQKCVHAHDEVATPITCKLDQRGPKSQINTRVGKNTQQAQLRTRRTTASMRTMENP